ncbi:hypothetical protein B0H10DRAFT_2009700 [Mycena sp. CBHHK59/15]|nr:hypothetical protein B0H10DRAFT_2009700 [Mycena sp. CBHHK59/15]
MQPPMPIIHSAGPSNAPKRCIKIIPSAKSSSPNLVIFIHALSLHRPARYSRGSLRQSRFVRSFVCKKEGVLHSRRQIMSLLQDLNARVQFTDIQDFSTSQSTNLPSKTAVDEQRVAPRCTSISVRRSQSNIPSPQSHLSFTAHREPLSALAINTPLPNLIPSSAFSSPFTPADQVLHTPSHPPEPHKGTPSRRHYHQNWQWSAVHLSRFTSPGLEENSSPARTPDTPDSPVCNLTRRLSLVAPPTRSIYGPRRLSYSQTSLASPVLIRSSLWAPSSPASPHCQLDDL